MVDGESLFERSTLPVAVSNFSNRSFIKDMLVYKQEVDEQQQIISFQEKPHE